MGTLECRPSVMIRASNILQGFAKLANIIDPRAFPETQSRFYRIETLCVHALGFDSVVGLWDFPCLQRVPFYGDGLILPPIQEGILQVHYEDCNMKIY